MSRIPRITLPELNDEQRRLYESITKGPRAKNLFGVMDADGALTGPFKAMLLYPPLGDAVQRLGATIRHGCTLSDRQREMTILMVAAAADCGYEQFAHEHIGLQLGLTEAEVKTIRERRQPDLADSQEAAITTTADRLLDHGFLTDEEYTEAVETLGPAKLFELCTLVGFYQLLALQIRVFGVEPPA